MHAENRIARTLRIVAVALGAAAGLAIAVPSVAQQPIKVGIALSSFSIAQGLSFIAQDGGFFKKEGLDVTLIDARTGAGAIQAALSGNVQLATGSLDSTLNATAQGKLVHVPLRLYSGQPGYLVISKKFADASKVSANAPIAERLKALNGATLASPSQSSTYTVMLKQATDAAGVKATITFVASEGMVAALSTNNVDGVIVSSPYAEMAVAQGNVLWVDGPKGEFPGTQADDFVVPLSVPDPFWKENRDAVERVIRAYIAASDFAKNNPSEAAKAIRGRFPNQDDALFALVWQRNLPAFTNVIPSVAALKRTLNQAAGSNAAKIKALDPEGMLLSDVVAKARAQVGGK